jgi:DNA-binding response OmpR family regulator
MSRKNCTLRIDEILLKDRLVTEDQVKLALDRQREHGGRLGSHLMRLGFVTEDQLLGALAKQFGCPSVSLAKQNIPVEVIRLLPANVAVARTVIPFAYDSGYDVLSVACEDPTDSELEAELKFVTGGKNIRLHVAAELSLRAAIGKHYVASGSTGRVAVVTDSPAAQKADWTSGSARVLVVSDDLHGDKPLVQALKNEEFQVVCSESADDAIDLLASQKFFAVFIRDTVPGDYIDLIDRLRKVSPRTKVRYYESAAQMFIHESGYRETEDLMVKNTELFTALLARRDKSDHNHAATVGRYVDRLCQQLGLPDKDRLNIVNAAYLHDISRYYYGESEAAPDCRTRVPMTAKLLDSLSYPPLVVGMLKSMYIDLEQKYTRRLPIEALGGNILTIVDVFCESVSFDRRLSLDKFEKVRSNLESLSGRLFLKEVTTAFLELIEHEILDDSSSQDGTYNQVLLYCSDPSYLDSVTGRLREDGFRPLAISDADKFVEMYRRSRPDMMVLFETGAAARARQTVATLIGKGVDIKETPTFLVSSGQAASELAAMLELGLEDVVAFENSLDLLIVKLQKLRARIAAQSTAPVPIIDGNAPSVTSGNVEDMNLVDLIQAMGPGGRTAKIKVMSGDGTLTICLDKGKIIYAECGDKTGAEAVYDGVTWRHGKWTVQPLKAGELPTPNNDDANEAILMEGCRRLDEKSRARK